MYRMYALSVSICGWFVDSRCSTAKVWFNKDGLIRSKSVAQEKYTDTNLSVSVCCQKLTIEFVSVYLSCAPDFERIQPSLLNHTLHSATKCIYSIYTVSQKNEPQEKSNADWFPDFFHWQTALYDIWGGNAPRFICWVWYYINCLFVYFRMFLLPCTFFLPHLLSYWFTSRLIYSQNRAFTGRRS